MFNDISSIAKRFILACIVALAILIAVLFQAGVVQAASQGEASLAKPSCERWHTIRSNDTLGGIANRFGVEPYQIVTSNDMKSPYTLYTGQKLCIPKPAVNAAQLKKLPKKYLNQGAVYFSLSWSPTGIVIKPLNFPVKSSMVVKADDLSSPAVKWDKLGVFTTKKDVKEYRIRLPRELTNAKQLAVCIKNLNTDVQMCRNMPVR
jgi:LysM repeat protein